MRQAPERKIIMGESVHLKNKYLDVTVQIPKSGKPISNRFDAACVVEQVVLNGKHRFCQPEQYDEKRVNTMGTGICSEFMDQYAAEAKAGEQFPKMGVGLFTQLSDNARLDRFAPYKVTPFRRSVQVSDKAVEFIQEPKPCMGISMRIRRRVSIHANQLRISTTLENVGERAYDCSEYQHNFLAIDDIPIGEGYRMTLPYDKEISNILTKGKRHAKNDGFRDMDEKGNPGKLVEIPVAVEGDQIVWKSSMDNKTFHKITRSDGIRRMAEYTWTLSRDGSSARVSETHHFQPSNFSIWGIEHTACNEVHYRIHVEPGEAVSFARTYTFEDETTGDL